MNTKYVQIDLEDGTGLVRVILWREQKECTAQRWLIKECNGNHLGWGCWQHVGGMLPRQPNVGTFGQHLPVVATKN